MGRKNYKKVLILDIVPPSENIIMDTNCMLFAVWAESFILDLTKASVHDIRYLQDVKLEYQGL